MDLDLSTPDKAKAAILKLMGENAAQAKALEAQGAQIQQTDAVINDLKAAVRALGEQQVVAGKSADADNRELLVYKTDATDHGVYRGLRLSASVDEDPRALIHPKREFGLLDDPVARTKWHAELQSLVEQRTWVRICAKTRGEGMASPKSDAAILKHLRNGPAEVQRIFADLSGVGAEVIPDLLMPDLERALILGQERRVAALFATVNMPGKNWLAPYASGGLRPYKKGEPSSATDDNPGQYTASNPTIAQRTITAVAMAVRCVVDDDASEDAIIAAVPLMQEFCVNALLDGEEDAFINSDTTASHQDTGLASWDPRGRWGTTGLGGASDHRRTVLGLRAEAIDSSATTDGGSVQTLAGLMTARGLMGLHAAPNVGDLVLITSVEYLLKICMWTEFVSVDKAGPLAFNINGLVGRVGDIPVVVSPFIDKQYNASGIYDNSTKTKTGALLVNRARWKKYLRKGAMVEAARDITRGITHFVATMRLQFKTLDTNTSTNSNVVWIYNLTP